MTAILATPGVEDKEPWHPEHMRSERLEDAAGHLPALADEVESAQGRILLTREGRPVLVLMSADELISLEETLFWCGVDLKRAVAGEPLDDEPGPGMNEAEARAMFAHLLPPRGE